jgi:hypothetical protein
MQNIDQPHAWALKHKWLLEAVFSQFDRDGEWPRIENVQRALANSDPERAVAVAQLAIDIPRELGAHLPPIPARRSIPQPCRASPSRRRSA